MHTFWDAGNPQHVVYEYVKWSKRSRQRKIYYVDKWKREVEAQNPQHIVYVQ